MKARFPKLITAVCLATAMLALPAAPAFAAPAQWSSVDVVLIDAQGTPTVLVAGQLGSTASLPADVTLSVPSGTNIEWAGEILGGDLAADPQVQYKTEARKGYDEVAFTLTKARRGQVEFSAPQLVKRDGESYTSTLSWKAASDVDKVTLTIQVPQGATIDDADGATADSGNYYSKEVGPVKAGEDVGLSITYTGGTPSSPATPPAGQQPPAPAPASGVAPTGGGLSPVTLVLILGGLLGAVFFGLNRLNAREAVTSEEVEEETEVEVAEDEDDPFPDA